MQEDQQVDRRRGVDAGASLPEDVECDSRAYSLVLGGGRVLPHGGQHLEGHGDQIKSMAEVIGILGMSGPVVLHTDSSSAKSFASRRGLGKARHIQTRCLWLQQAVADRQVMVRKVAGARNPADILTKYLSRELAYQMAELMRVQLVWRPRA